MWNLFFWPHFCRKYAFRGFWTWVWALKAQWFNFLNTTQFTLMVNSIHFHGQFVNVFVHILIDEKKHLDIYFVEIHGCIMCTYSIRVFNFMDLGDIWPTIHWSNAHRIVILKRLYCTPWILDLTIPDILWAISKEADIEGYIIIIFDCFLVGKCLSVNIVGFALIVDDTNIESLFHQFHAGFAPDLVCWISIW